MLMGAIAIGDCQVQVQFAKRWTQMDATTASGIVVQQLVTDLLDPQYMDEQNNSYQ